MAEEPRVRIVVVLREENQATIGLRRGLLARIRPGQELELELPPEPDDPDSGGGIIVMARLRGAAPFIEEESGPSIVVETSQTIDLEEFRQEIARARATGDVLRLEARGYD